MIAGGQVILVAQGRTKRAIIACFEKYARVCQTTYTIKWRDKKGTDHAGKNLRQVR